MAKLADLLGKYLVEWPDGAEYARQDADKEVCFWGCGVLHDFFLPEIADDAHTEGGTGCKKVYQHEYLAARDRIATNMQATKEAREIAHGVELPKHGRKLWKRAALAAFAGYCARPGMDAECAAEEAMFAADAFMNAMDKHLSSN